MKKIKHLFSNTLTLILLLVLGVVLALFLSRRSENDHPVAQATQAEVTTAPATEVKATPTPATTPTATLAPATQPAEPPKDDTPEPTWTPVIIFPVGTPPPLPSPPPTPTATPINPNESEVAAFDVPVGGPIVSPDDQALAVVAGLEFLPEQGGRFITQIWIIDLPTKQVEKLDASGVMPTWSPDGQRILFLVRRDDQFEIKITDRKGSSEETLVTIAEKDFLDYYWATSNQVDIVRPDGIQRTDLGRKSTEQVINLTVPAKTQGGTKPQVAEYPGKVIVVGDGRNLLIIQQDGQSVSIADIKGRSIGEFALSVDGQKLTYIVNEGRSDELWSNNLIGKSPKMLYRIDGGHIHDLAWAPNGQAVVIGWRETGTSLGADLTLLWINVDNSQTIPLQVDGVERGFVFSHKGDRLFYSRTFYADPTDEGRTAFYQLEIKP
ncbi:MAG: hypothetical protein HC875_10385 [Anaerolineales bacterium]|nr:hypothetical protein [Anaerolineales bacterium]